MEGRRGHYDRLRIHLGASCLYALVLILVFDTQKSTVLRPERLLHNGTFVSHSRITRRFTSSTTKRVLDCQLDRIFPTYTLIQKPTISPERIQKHYISHSQA